MIIFSLPINGKINCSRIVDPETIYDTKYLDQNLNNNHNNDTVNVTVQEGI